MRNQNAIYAAGKFRTINFPSLGAYDLVTGQGYSAGDYAKSPCAYACMDIRATALAEIPWRLVRKTSAGGANKTETVEEHPIIDLLNGWGQEMNWADAIRATEIDMCMYGCAFWLKDVDRLARLNPATIEVMVSTKKVTGFKQRILSAGRTYEQTFSRDEVLYFREYHPTDDLGKGVPKISVAKNAILAEYEAQRYIKSFFENDAIPGLLIHTEQDVPPQEMTKLATWWQTKFGGARNHHKVAFVDKGLEAQVLSTDLRAMAMEAVRDEARRDICEVFGLDPILVGAAGKGSFSNTHEARLSLFQEVIIPRADYYGDVINAELVEYIDPEVEIEWAVDEIPILQEDKDKLATRLTSLLDKNVVTVEFVREQLGIPDEAGPSTEEIKADAEKQLQAEAEAKRPPEVGQWKKKAMKALKRGESANVAFETDALSPALQGALRARLGQAKTLEDIDVIFSSTVGTTKAMNDAMTKVTKALEELKPPEPQPVHVDVHVPVQPAPVVNVSLKTPKLRGTTQIVNRNKNTGAIESTTVTHDYEDEDGDLNS